MSYVCSKTYGIHYHLKGCPASFPSFEGDNYYDPSWRHLAVAKVEIVEEVYLGIFEEVKGLVDDPTS